MSLADIQGMTLSPAERSKASVLVIESDGGERQRIRQALKSLGYGSYTDVPNHAAAIDRLNERQISHVIFEATNTNMPANAFLKQLLEMDNKIIAIPSSYDPNIDDVFDLMVMGARGYLVKPITVDNVDNALVMASKGEPLADVVLEAKDRNEALVAMTMSSLDKCATVLRQASQFETAKREVPRALAALQRSADLARTFSKGGEEGMMAALEKFCIERSKGPATRLGRLRKRLHQNRAD